MKGRAIRVGVIGCGYWGPNLVRNFARHAGSQVQAVCDRQFERATQAIEAGKHVLVMKPLTTRVDHAEELCALAERQGVLVAVDHTFVFTGAVRRMKQLIADGEIGDLYYF